MDDGPEGALSGATGETPRQMANEENPVVDVSPIPMMQNLEGPKETPHITTVVRGKDVTQDGQGEEE